MFSRFWYELTSNNAPPHCQGFCTLKCYGLLKRKRSSLFKSPLLAGCEWDNVHAYLYCAKGINELLSIGSQDKGSAPPCMYLTRSILWKSDSFNSISTEENLQREQYRETVNPFCPIFLDSSAEETLDGKYSTLFCFIARNSEHRSKEPTSEFLHVHF